MIEAHLLSGGVDSVSVLYRRLRDTTNPVHVLHLRGVTLGDEAQTRAARCVVVWLAGHLRPVEYHEFTPMRLVGKPCGNTLFARQGFAIGEYIVRNPFIATVVQGTNGEGDQSEASLGRNRYRAAVCAAVCSGYAPAPTWICPHQAVAKREAYLLMPPELRDLCWTCPDPTQVGDVLIPCGRCDKCLELQHAKEAA